MKILDAVFLQPTYACALNCPGCYVKESTHGPQMSLELWIEFINWLWSGHQIYPRQITLALDNLPLKNVDTTKQAMLIMTSTLRRCLQLREQYGSRTQFHITTHSISTLYKYLSFVSSLGGANPPVDLMSISQIRPQDEPWLHNAAGFTKLINYNLLVDDKPGFQFNKLKRKIAYLHSVHVMLHKPGLSESYDPDKIRNYKLMLKVMHGQLSPKEKKKIIVDACVKDSYNFLVKGYGCGANVRKLHIWPDGHVTGCPYDQRGGKSAKTLKELIENTYTATQQYDFVDCKLPTEYYTPTFSRPARLNLPILS